MKYEIILFDADETLFDFRKSEREALKETMLEFNIKYDEEYHLKIYKEINNAIWKEFDEGAITQQKLKFERFKRLSNRLEDKFNEIEFSKSFVKNLAEASFLFEDSVTLIKTLQESCRLAIITNGFKDVQNYRIKKSVIGKYFEDIVISEEVKVAKPDSKIFEQALNNLNHTDKSKVLMVGDSLTSDIQGGINFGIDTCWFNPRKTVNTTKIKPTFEISNLMEVKDIV
jgi:putative hydrolase of the HAD superfamily